MGKDIILIAGGSSVKSGLSLGLWDKIKGKADIWSLNYAWLEMPYLPTAQLWVDLEVWRLYEKKITELHNKGVKLIAKEHDKYKHDKRIEQYDTSNGQQGGEEKKGKIFVGRSGLCGMFALSMALLKKYDRIFMLGYDFGVPSIGDIDTHWEKSVSHRGLHNVETYMQGNGRPKPAVNDYEELDKSGYEIYNVSSKKNGEFRTNIKCFDIITYEEFFKILEEK